MGRLKILIVEPYFTGSHRQWAREYQLHSSHDVRILSLPGRHWKWRMAGGAISLARRFLDSDFQPDVLLASDMLQLPLFMALAAKRLQGVKTSIYFHENQLTYPWSPDDPDAALRRDHHYGFINYTSALCAGTVFFNSHFHRQSFLSALPEFLKKFPDENGLEEVPQISRKSEVLPIGLDLKRLEQYRADENSRNRIPVILWNHRWEYDKDPNTFFKTLYRLKAARIPFRLIVLGQAFREVPPIFQEARQRLADKILYFGYAHSFADYAHHLWQADILPVTSRQDFFGISAVQAIYCNCLPLLPDRLAFPGHIPQPYQSEYLYKNDDELYRKLKSILSRWEPQKQTIEFQNFVSHYDWSILAPHYDKRLQLTE